MSAINTEQLFAVLDYLDLLEQRFIIVGGAIVGLLVDHPELIDFRPTKDVDILVEVASRIEYSHLEEKLRALGLRNDTSEDAPLCRWIVNESVKLDVLPLDDSILGFSSEWFEEAWKHPQHITLEERNIETISPVYLIASKLAAFTNRGNQDFWMSHDLEDLITVIDGRENIEDEIRHSKVDVREYISGKLRDYLSEADFRQALPAYLDSDLASQERLPSLRRKIEGIARMSSADETP
jgi:hypothetical protein